MLFNDPAFIVFLAAVVAADRVLPQRLRVAFLLASSWVFYGWWNWRFVPLLIACSSIDYLAGRTLSRAGSRGSRLSTLWLSLGANLAILGYFKLVHSRTGAPLPVGVSFYTFQSMSYSIDVYRGRVKACESWLEYSLFVSFFPHLVAGPIQRAEKLLPQLQRPRAAGAVDFREGFALLFIGYLKKSVLADNVAPIVDACFRDYAGLPSGQLLLGLVLFSLQVYWDFSGYSDIARGAARWFGVELGPNFEQPYLAPNIREFWRRWNISLSDWMRDYLYIPLGGSRHGTPRWLLSLFATMLLGAFWHGTGLNFVLFGFLHGVYLAVHRLWSGPAPREAPRPDRSASALLGRAASCVLTYLFVLASFISFRSQDLRSAAGYLLRLVRWTGPLLPQQAALMALAVGACLAIDVPMRFGEGHHSLLRAPVWLRQAVVAAGTVAIVVSMAAQYGAARPFIYFQF